jgi:hypothetical protein
MKKLGLLTLLSISAYTVFSIATAKVYITKPEQGITCLQVETYDGTRQPAGCFDGDVHGNNTFNKVATNKYQ